METSECTSSSSIVRLDMHANIVKDVCMVQYEIQAIIILKRLNS